MRKRYLSALMASVMCMSAALPVYAEEIRTDEAETAYDTYEEISTEETAESDISDITDDMISDTDTELMTDENTAGSVVTGDWYKWDNSTRTLELFGEIPRLWGSSIGFKTGSSSAAKIVIDEGTTAPIDSKRLFENFKQLKEIEGIEHLDVSNVTNMYGMFENCESLTSLDLTGWNVGKVTDMANMFDACRSMVSLDLSGWDTSSVTEMWDMFNGCYDLCSLDVSGWDTSSVTTMSSMFYRCFDLPALDLTGWDTSNVTNMREMFCEARSLERIKGTDGFDTGKVTSMYGMFRGCKAVRELSVSGFDTGNVTTMCMMFAGCNSLPSLDVTNFDTSNVTDMRDMFGTCRELRSLDLSSFDTSKVTDMTDMFSYDSKLEVLDVSSFDTSNVVKISEFLMGCSSLKAVDVSGFDTSKMIYFAHMFGGCESLTSLDVSHFDTRNVRCTISMFSGCKKLRSLDLSSFDLSALDNSYSSSLAPDSRMFDKTDSLVSLKLPKGFEVTDDMQLPNKTTDTIGWVRKGTSVIISGTAKYAMFTAPATAEYIRVSGSAIVIPPAKPSVTVKAVFGGRTVNFYCEDYQNTKVFYEFGTSNITTSSPSTTLGRDVFLDKPMATAMFYKAYNGKWSPVAKQGINNVRIAKPIITRSGPASQNKFRIYTQTRDSYIIYTLDGSIPSINEGTNKLTVKNGRLVWGTSAVIDVPKGRTVKAIAVRCGLVTSEVMTYTNR